MKHVYNKSKAFKEALIVGALKETISAWQFEGVLLCVKLRYAVCLLPVCETKIQDYGEIQIAIRKPDCLPKKLTKTSEMIFFGQTSQTFYYFGTCAEVIMMD